MESRANYLFVGLAVLVLTLAAAGGIIWLLKNKSGESLKHYGIYFQNQSLSGIGQGSLVTIKGIQVGSVEKISFVASDVERVFVLISVRMSAPVKTDTKAVIKSNLVTGVSRVELVGATQQAPLLTETLPGEHYPVIQEGQERLEALASDLPELVKQVQVLLTNLSSLLNTENRARFSRVLRNLQKLTGDLSKQNAGELIKEVQSLTKDARELVHELARGVGGIDRSVTKAADSVADATSEISSKIGRTADAVEKTASEFDQPSKLLYGPNPSQLGPGEKDLLRKYNE